MTRDKPKGSIHLALSPPFIAPFYGGTSHGELMSKGVDTSNCTYISKIIEVMRIVLKVHFYALQGILLLQKILVPILC